MKEISILLLICTLLSSCGTSKSNESRVEYLPYYSEATFTPQWLNPDSKELEDFHSIADFSLMNQDGQVITEKTFEDKIYITDFFFTYCKGICPKMTENMEVLQQEFLKDTEVLLLSHSVTPDHDSVPVLKSYAENKGVISGKWHLVTGTLHDIYSLGRDSYFVEEDLGLEKKDEDFLHTENFVLVDKHQHIRGIYNGLDKADLAQLVKDVRTLKDED